MKKIKLDSRKLNLKKESIGSLINKDSMKNIIGGETAPPPPPSGTLPCGGTGSNGATTCGGQVTCGGFTCVYTCTYVCPGA